MMSRTQTWKALTISQPFADLIASGKKFVENRSWVTNYRGPLSIHAGKGTQYRTRKQLENYTTGAVIATTILIACIELSQPADSELAVLEQHGMTLEQVLNHRHCEGPVAWVLFETRRCAEPFRINGKQGLWSFETTDQDSFAF